MCNVWVEAHAVKNFNAMNAFLYMHFKLSRHPLKTLFPLMQTTSAGRCICSVSCCQLDFEDPWKLHEVIYYLSLSFKHSLVLFQFDIPSSLLRTILRIVFGLSCKCLCGFILTERNILFSPILNHTVRFKVQKLFTVMSHNLLLFYFMVDKRGLT